MPCEATCSSCLPPPCGEGSRVGVVWPQCRAPITLNASYPPPARHRPHATARTPPPAPPSDLIRGPSSTRHKRGMVLGSSPRTVRGWVGHCAIGQGCSGLGPPCLARQDAPVVSPP